MEFLDVNPNDVLIMRGAGLAMGLDHNNQVYYVLMLVGGDFEGKEQVVTFAIPPNNTQELIRVVRAMDPKNE